MFDSLNRRHGSSVGIHHQLCVSEEQDTKPQRRLASWFCLLEEGSVQGGFMCSEFMCVISRFGSFPSEF